jgi:hypothetical protein
MASDTKTFLPGVRVHVNYKQLGSYYAPGTVARRNVDGTYAIDYDDGEKEQNVDPKLIFPYGNHPQPNSGVGSGGISPLLEAPPSILVPVSVMHRRNTSTEEVKQKLSELASDQAALRASISKAETIAAMVHRFASLYAARKQLMAMSIPRRRWVLAIRKTIQIIATNGTG